jgi:hypothetical protein
MEAVVKCFTIIYIIFSDSDEVLRKKNVYTKHGFIHTPLGSQRHRRAQNSRFDTDQDSATDKV